MGVWSWDIQKDQRYFDNQVCYLLGIDPLKFYGTFDEFIKTVHPDDRKKISNAFNNITDNMNYDADYRVVWSDKSVHHIAARGKLLRNDYGKAV